MSFVPIAILNDLYDHILEIVNKRDMDRVKNDILNIFKSDLPYDETILKLNQYIDSYESYEPNKKNKLEST